MSVNLLLSQRQLIDSSDLDKQHKLILEISQNYNLDYQELINKFLDTSSETGKNNKEINVKEKNVKKPRKSSKKDIIKTYKISYNDIEYLVDDNNNVFTFDTERPKIVGVKLINDTIKMY